jgi:hypothetical protein
MRGRGLRAQCGAQDMRSWPLPRPISRDGSGPGRARKGDLERSAEWGGGATEPGRAERDPQGQSVFANYQLVNTLWVQSPATDYTPPCATAPLNAANMLSAGQNPVANSTMETYVQAKTCRNCHQYATVTGGGTCPQNGNRLASDFSFIFGLAQ